MPSLLRYPLALFFVLALSSSLSAQRDRDTYSSASANAIEIVGQVRVADSGLPGRRVPIRLERFGGGIVDQIDTDNTGRFRFANLPRGYYRVILNVPGYRAASQDADLQVVFRASLFFELVTENSGPAALLDVIDARAPAEAREELVRGRTALSKKLYPEAIEHLEKAIGFYPDFFEAHLWLGTALLDGRDWTKAEQAFQRAVELKATSPVAMLALGEVYWRQKRFAEAEKSLLAGLKLDDKSWHGYFTLGRLYFDQDNIAKAGPAIGRTLQLKPDFAEAHLLAGNILLRVNQPERALASYQEYLKLEPKGEFAEQARDLVAKLSRSISEKKN
ncbi:MAG TPA: tetratricopeptide repeat protein [Pyrinomonadaceae bacterium]|nr:tetratricopeptide repeat protein [Pyrinomonadaceae bacterium]